MNRVALLFLFSLLLSLSCARRPTYVVDSAPAAPGDSASVGDTAAPLDDGTVHIAGPNQDDEWLSVVGEPKAVAKADDPKPQATKNKKKDKATEKKADTASAEARAFFAGRCVACHGESGRGDGPAGAAFKPPPRNFTDKAWQTSVSDAHIEKVILNGGAANGLSPIMPPHSDLGDKPELLAAMRKLIRELGA